MDNILKKEKSPYLLAHADNPIHWQTWNATTLKLAQSTNRLIFVSVGYSTCHWCHVMEKESFRNEAIAQFMNQNLISIKVDREERPDIDAFLMLALQLTGEKGGWPLNMFLTPQGHPITGGTYFPPAPVLNRPSFIEITKNIVTAWQEHPQQIIAGSKAMMKYLYKLQPQNSQDTNTTKRLSSSPYYFAPVKEQKIIFATIKQHISYLSSRFDREHGGFLFAIDSHIKFPNFIELLFLIRYTELQSEFTFNNIFIIFRSIIAIKHGGIYDQIDGGIARYSTDRYWRLPHFEKTLYDNALYLMTLCNVLRLLNHNANKIAFITKQEAIYLDKNILIEWIHEQFMFLQSSLLAPDNCFWSAIDADSEGEEGKFYVWKKKEVEKALQTDPTIDPLADIYSYWNISEEGNFAHQNNNNILYTSHKQFLTYFRTKYSQIKKSKKILKNIRSNRKHPLTDNKAITSWNALTISALVKTASSLALGNPKLASVAQKLSTTVAENIWQYCYVQEYQKFRQLTRIWYGHTAAHYATLTDYSSLGNAYLDLYEHTLNTTYLYYCIIISYDIFLFYGNDTGDGFYENSIQAQDIIMRQELFHDHVEPSGISMVVKLLYRLARYGFNLKHLISCYSNIRSNKFNVFKKYLIDPKLQSKVNDFPLSFLELISLLKKRYLDTKNNMNQAYFLQTLNEIYQENLLTIALVFQSPQIELSKPCQDFLVFIRDSANVITICANSLNTNTQEIIPILQGKTLAKEHDYGIWICTDFSCQTKPIYSFTQAKTYLTSSSF